MELDQSTLAAILCIKSIIASFIFYIVFSLGIRFPGISLWALGSLSIGVAVFLDIAGMRNTTQLGTVFYNIALVSGQVLFLFGTCRFVGRPFKPYALPLMLFLISLVSFIFTVVVPDSTLRLLALSPIYIGANLWMALILWRFRATRMQFAYIMASAIMFIQAAAALMQMLVGSGVSGFDFPAYLIIWINAVATIVLGSWVLFLLITFRLIEQLNSLAEKRERERIARELHDTVLQTFQGFVMKANALLPEADPSLKENLRRCLRDAITAIDEGRDKIGALRGGPESCPALHEYLRLTGEQEAASGQQFTLRCTGSARALKLTVHRELCAIGKEAICNAFRHANARKYEVGVEYGASALILTIQDDGEGIGVGKGGHGHWGIQGIEERASLIQAKATLQTACSAGTTWRIELEAALAYDEFENNAYRIA